MHKAIMDFCKNKGLPFKEWKLQDTVFTLKGAMRPYRVVRCNTCGGYNFPMNYQYEGDALYCPKCNIEYLNRLLTKPLPEGSEVNNLIPAKNKEDVTFKCGSFLHGIHFCEKHNTYSKYRIINGEYYTDIKYCQKCLSEHRKSNEYFEQTNSTYQKKYGMSNSEYRSSKMHQDKVISINLKRYGTKHYSKTEDFWHVLEIQA